MFNTRRWEINLREETECQEHSSVGIELIVQLAHLPGTGQSSQVGLDEASSSNQERQALSSRIKILIERVKYKCDLF